MEKFSFKKIAPYCAILIVFVIAGCIYFAPALQGKIIYAGDNVNVVAAIQELNRFYDETKESSAWTGSMFSGMPSYQLAIRTLPSFTVNYIMQPLMKIFTSGIYGNLPILFFFYLLAFFLLLRTFKIDKWLSLAGSFAIALSSYFFIIIAAQHHGKCYSITWMTLVVVGFILTFRKNYCWGAVLTMLFTYVGFFVHPQMSYYICMLIGMLFLAELYSAWKAKAWKHCGIATAVFALSFTIGLGMGSDKIFSNLEYAEQTMRGGHSDLTKESDAELQTKGLDLDYATVWSYGIDETMTLLIPNFEGGASGYNVGDKSLLYESLVKAGVGKKEAKNFCENAPTYRGEKPFTSGPVYVGAIIIFLFILSLFIVKGPYKWALLAATLFSLFLAWGHNMMWLTKFFYNFFPAYNKFRAVESILIIAEIAIPLMAFLALKEIALKSVDFDRLKKSIFLSAGISGGICLLVMLFSGSIDVTSSYDTWKGNLPANIYNAILAQRTDMISSDALRSLIFILLGGALTLFYANSTYKKPQNNNNLWFGLALTALVVADMWTIDKRFCNDSQFVNAKDLTKTFRMTRYEEELTQDKSHFRVLNLASNTFNEARTSYYLKSIGGYSAAKLRRYQDLIDEHIAPEMNPLLRTIAETNGLTLPVNGDSIFPVLNMLNMKYALVPLQTGDIFPVENPFAMGNAWLVDSLLTVDNANEECAAIGKINLHKTAVIDGKMTDGNIIRESKADSSAKIELTKYTPRYIDYTSQTQCDKLAVFSEIFYPYGWKAFIDEKEVPIYRVNYMLRAINLPAGNHKIHFTFEPDSIAKGNILALSCLFLFLLTLLFALYRTYKSYKSIKEKDGNAVV